MAGKRITVVLSQTQSKNPAQRNLEEEIAAGLIVEPSVDFSIVPHLYDLPADHSGMLFLRSVPADVVVLGWMYPRAIRWTLDRNGVKGREGKTLLATESDDNLEDGEADEVDREEAPGGIGAFDAPDRNIYCVDLREHSEADALIEEVKRIATETSVRTVELAAPTPGGTNGSGKPSETLLSIFSPSGNGESGAAPREDGPAKRRWYPVIDYDRCTNCMECIDFCLFGVYGLDEQERILVEEQDNCKKGCPACSRVCPENAIIFPQHKTPAIAGASTGSAGAVKIDLSKLFGGPSAIDRAVAERDVELVRDGREAVGMAVGIPKRQPSKPERPRDELDDLMDDLDNLDL